MSIFTFALSLRVARTLSRLAQIAARQCMRAGGTWFVRRTAVVGLHCAQNREAEWFGSKRIDLSGAVLTIEGRNLALVRTKSDVSVRLKAARQER